MEINGMVYCMFEQSGVFKNEFKKLGINAVDMDIQNNFNETNYQIDLFAEIENGYAGEPSIFDNITQDDLIIAFFPCIYFCGSNNPLEFSFATHKELNDFEKIKKIIQRAKNREFFYELLLKFVGVCIKKNIRMIFENPFSVEGFLHNNFVKAPSIIDKNRMERGDYFRKPTAYWFFNCEPTHGSSFQNDKEQRSIRKTPWSGKTGLCSEARSMISSDYARNFIHDFILGKQQDIGQMQLF